jgi:Protein of unknown function (DUF3237)
MKQFHDAGLPIVLLLIGGNALADGPSTQIKSEYLMTYVAQLGSEYPISRNLTIVNVLAGGSAKGPRISGTFVAPGGDWLRRTPSGALRIDVRATIKTDDGAFIYMSYNGVLQESADSARKLARGELLTTKDFSYCIGAPTFETSSSKYAWINNVQAVSKFVEFKDGEGGYIKYDVFILR